MAFIAKQNLHSRPVHQLGILRRALGQDGVHRFGRRSTRECDGESPMMRNRALRARNKFVGSGRCDLLKILEYMDAGLGHQLLPLRRK